MEKKTKRHIKRLVPKPNLNYDNRKRFRMEEIDVTKALEKIKNIQLSPNELRHYGFDANWKEKIPEKVFVRLAVAIEKNEKAIKELEKY